MSIDGCVALNLIVTWGIKWFNYVLMVQKAMLFLHRGVSSLTGIAQ